jgi:hypothetical protein
MQCTTRTTFVLETGSHLSCASLCMTPEQLHSLCCHADYVCCVCAETETTTFMDCVNCLIAFTNNPHR